MRLLQAVGKPHRIERCRKREIVEWGPVNEPLIPLEKRTMPQSDWQKSWRSSGNLFLFNVCNQEYQECGPKLKTTDCFFLLGIVKAKWPTTVDTTGTWSSDDRGFPHLPLINVMTHTQMWVSSCHPYSAKRLRYLVAMSTALYHQTPNHLALYPYHDSDANTSYTKHWRHRLLRLQYTRCTYTDIIYTDFIAHILSPFMRSHFASIIFMIEITKVCNCRKSTQ